VYEPLQEPNRYDLHLAVENNCPRSVEKLLQYNIPLVDSQHDTILSYASDPRVVKLLLDAGAPLTSRRWSFEDSRKALEAAVTKWVPRSVKLLLKAGARIGRSQLEAYITWTCPVEKVPDKVEVLQLLLDKYDKRAGIVRNKQGKILGSDEPTKAYIICRDGCFDDFTLLHVCAEQREPNPSSSAVAGLLLKRYPWLQEYLFKGQTRQLESVHSLAMEAGNVSVVREIANFVKFPKYRKVMTSSLPGVVASMLQSVPNARDCVEIVRLWADAGVDFSVRADRTCVQDLVAARQGEDTCVKDRATAIIIAEIAEAVLAHPRGRNKRRRIV
jgi:hypothetical protein